MKIYTKTGDRGETSLLGGQRLPKDAIRIEAYGTVDELNAMLGIVRADSSDPDVGRILHQVQNRLFDIGADLAAPRSAGEGTVRRTEASDAEPLEHEIDALETSLTPLHNFIIPGGSLVAARLHLARTVCRRAERAVVRLSHHEDISAGVIIYLNRLSDLLFVLARAVNHRAQVKETTWKP